MAAIQVVERKPPLQLLRDVVREPAIWRLLVNKYTAAIAPKGQEGTYYGLSLIPWFVAKTLVGLISGHMLAYWSPERVVVNGVSLPLQQAMIQGQVSYWHSPAAMWLVLGVWAFVGCLAARLIRGWLTQGGRWKVEV
ncbi:MAG: hypothetical protein KA354_07440 [Phycisphaerae bacterium]|nr:hypothetical protein [Phycisphaerae bacterium]